LSHRIAILRLEILLSINTETAQEPQTNTSNEEAHAPVTEGAAEPSPASPSQPTKVSMKLPVYSTVEAVKVRN